MFTRNQTAFAEYERVILSQETTNSEAFTKTGMTAGTLLETPHGWYPVEQLNVGDRIATLDGDMARVIATRHDFAEPVSMGTPSDGFIHVPGGALENCSDLLLPVEQLVQIESPEAEKLLGEPSVLVPAQAFEGYRGISRQFPKQRVEVINIQFEDEEIVFANSGVRIYCGSGMESDYFSRLDAKQSRALLQLMNSELGFLSPIAEARFAA
ncbi:Hint domain-containing protein [Halocynthiibacter namhaensis]|uniref:Hint domain-containing protein n=1 Tax=Halocynthiibacter namhaensis TaxID=1290553 RepID=UPI00068D946F|nr:Hint domain-containing protein [Halocynthiibacter namhaensis]